MKLIKTADAHCDIPCGIYEVDTLRNSAETCRRMVEILLDLQELQEHEHYNTFVRTVMNKEKHAQKVKDEVCILWTDYFKPEHFDEIDGLHDTLRKTAKQASVVKQTVSVEEAERLVEMVKSVSDIFLETKK